VTRRNLIQRLVCTLGLAFGQAAEALARPVRAVSDGTSKTGPLSSGEVDELVAFAEALVNERPFSAEERKYVVEHIDDRTKDRPEAIVFYRRTVGTLRRLAGRPVSSLHLRERMDLITRHRLAVSRIGPDENLGPFAEDIRVLRRRAAPDLIGGYYGSPAGWAVVGYEVFPGRCGDLTRYTRPEG
jgi:hypothetical protein